MPFLYILENLKKKHYVGITNLFPFERLKRHNKGDVYSTKFSRPWNIIWVQKFDNLVKAREFEKKIKSWKGCNAFKKFLSKVAGSSNGRTPPFGGGYPGSNPGPAALDIKMGGISTPRDFKLFMSV